MVAHDRVKRSSGAQTRCDLLEFFPVAAAFAAADHIARVKHGFGTARRYERRYFSVDIVVASCVAVNGYAPAAFARLIFRPGITGVKKEQRSQEQCVFHYFPQRPVSGRNLALA